MVIALSAISTSVYSMTANPWPKFYPQASEIRIIGPMAVVVGSTPEGSNMITSNMITINLTDVAIYSGHKKR